MNDQFMGRKPATSAWLFTATETIRESLRVDFEVLLTQAAGVAAAAATVEVIASDIGHHTRRTRLAVRNLDRSTPTFDQPIHCGLVRVQFGNDIGFDALVSTPGSSREETVKPMRVHAMGADWIIGGVGELTLSMVRCAAIALASAQTAHMAADDTTELAARAGVVDRARASAGESAKN